MLNLLENTMAAFLKYHGNIFYLAILDAIIRMTVKDQKQWMRIYACLLRDVQCAFRKTERASSRMLRMSLSARRGYRGISVPL